VDCPSCGTETGTITVGGPVTIAGTGTLTSYTYTQSGVSSSMTFSGASTFTVGAGGFSLSDGTFTANNATMTVNGACTINSGAFNAPSGTLTVNNGTFTFSSGTFTGSSGSMTVNGSFSASTGTFTASSTSLTISGSFTLSSGTFTAPSGNMYVGGNWSHTSGATFNNNNGTVTFNGGFNSYITVPTTETFYNLTLNKSASYYYGYIYNYTLKTTGALSLTQGYFNNGGSGTLEAQGNVTVGANYGSSNNTPLLFDGGNTQTFNLTGATAVFSANITVNKSGGEVGLASDLVMGAANQNLTITGGTFDLSGKNLTVNGSGGTFTVQSGGNLQLQGGETITGTPTLNSGSTVTYDGTSAAYTLQNYTYSNLTINGGASSIFQLPANLTVNSTVTITSGTCAST